MQNSGSADSFTQQMLNEIERRCKEFQLSSLSIHLNDEFDDKEYETSPNAKHHTTLPLDVSNTKCHWNGNTLSVINIRICYYLEQNDSNIVLINVCFRAEFF